METIILRLFELLTSYKFLLIIFGALGTSILALYSDRYKTFMSKRYEVSENILKNIYGFSNGTLETQQKMRNLYDEAWIYLSNKSINRFNDMIYLFYIKSDINKNNLEFNKFKIQNNQIYHKLSKTIKRKITNSKLKGSELENEILNQCKTNLTISIRKDLKVNFFKVLINYLNPIEFSLIKGEYFDWSPIN